MDAVGPVASNRNGPTGGNGPDASLAVGADPTRRQGSCAMAAARALSSPSHIARTPLQTNL